MNRHQRRAAHSKVWSVIYAETYRLGDREALYWFQRPEGMTKEQAFKTQAHYGPFATEAEVCESQRVTLFGEKCKVTEGGEFDPAWRNLN